MDDKGSGYGLAQAGAAGEMTAPELPYLPPRPRSYRPAIGLIGCGGISEYHFRAYRAMDLNVVAVCDVDEDRAVARANEFYPKAKIYSNYLELLQIDEVEVVDIALHPAPRVAAIEATLRAGKHVLSQKPFVLDLPTGHRLCDLADACGRRLAVNQNGRWAPHFAYLRAALRAGVIGDLSQAVFALEWDHTWTAGTPFDAIRHLLLYDFGIHWFDICHAFFGEREATSVQARVASLVVQKPQPPMLAHVIIEYANGQATLSLNGHVSHGQRDQTTLCGSLGTLRGTGPSLSEQRVTVHTADGHASPNLSGTWFESGFQGAMGELLCAIEEGRAPDNNARDNLRGLALCFAACASADAGGAPVVPGAATRAPE